MESKNGGNYLTPTLSKGRGGSEATKKGNKNAKS
jgi:hypothetical protein